jgi:DNA-binding transcriptional LysR family regulator
MKFTTISVARKLKFYQLVVFDQVLQSGSLVRAAQALNLTQPAVTKIIHELESYFDAPLLIRGNRGVTATELGELVVRRAKSLLAELRSLTDEVNAFQEGTSGHVMVGTLISAFYVVAAQGHAVAQATGSWRAGVVAGRANGSTVSGAGGGRSRSGGRPRA